ncbi:MAG: hypothetical protein ACOCRX_08670 [Candidatus Woesearchaeota archaeon]
MIFHKIFCYEVLMGESRYANNFYKSSYESIAQEFLKNLRENKKQLEQELKQLFEISSLEIKSFDFYKKQHDYELSILYFVKIEVSNEEKSKFLQKAEEIGAEFKNDK